MTDVEVIQTIDIKKSSRKVKKSSKSRDVDIEEIESDVVPHGGLTDEPAKLKIEQG